MTESALRSALYYPYIHIRSEKWLKATLLFAPNVRRIVPSDYTPEDDYRIARYTTIEGPYGALLQAVPSFTDAGFAAQHRLLEKLRQNEAQVIARYSRDPAAFRDAYWLHYAKFDYELIEFLHSRGLAWHSLHSSAYGRNRNWYAMHPLLGSAIMTTLGVSIAREQNYDIVTSSKSAHDVLLGVREDQIFDAVLRGSPVVIPREVGQQRRDLAELVITFSGLNFQALPPEAIPALQSSKYFSRFQELIRRKAASVARDTSDEEYVERLKIEADEIIESWHNVSGDIGKELRRGLFDQGAVLSGEALKAMFKGFSSVDLAVAGGLSIVLVTKRVADAFWAHRSGPYRYLTQILRSQREPLRVRFPLGLEV